MMVVSQAIMKSFVLLGSIERVFLLSSHGRHPGSRQGCLRDVTELGKESRKSKTLEIEKQLGSVRSVAVQIPKSLAYPCRPKVSNNRWIQPSNSKSKIRKLDNARRPSTVVLRLVPPNF